jgi:hypothetical protein
MSTSRWALPSPAGPTGLTVRRLNLCGARPAEASLILLAIGAAGFVGTLLITTVLNARFYPTLVAIPLSTSRWALPSPAGPTGLTVRRLNLCGARPAEAFRQSSQAFWPLPDITGDWRRRFCRHAAYYDRSERPVLSDTGGLDSSHYLQKRSHIGK